MTISIPSVVLLILLSLGIPAKAQIIATTIPTPSITEPPENKGKWFFSVNDPDNPGPTAFAGPYGFHGGCNDTAGSALYEHPFACHTDPSPVNCKIIGNGFGFPKNVPFPAPKLYVTNGCFQSTQAGVPAGWYFFFFPSTGGAILEKCSDHAKYKKLADTVPGDRIGHYANLGCPGAPCFSIGFDTACN